MKNGPFKSEENFVHLIFRYNLKRNEYWDDGDNEQKGIKVPAICSF